MVASMGIRIFTPEILPSLRRTQEMHSRFADAPGCIEWQDLILFSALYGKVWRGIDIWIEAFPHIPVQISLNWNCFFLMPMFLLRKTVERYGWRKLFAGIIWPWEVVDMSRHCFQYPDGPRQDLCKGVGACCNPVEAPTQEWILSRMEAEGKVFPLEDVKFILEVLRPISREEGYRMNPHLREKHVGIGEDKQLVDIKGKPYRFYECPYYDKEHRWCTVHGTPLKPPVCRNYPLYDGKNLCNKKLATPECGYHALQPEVQTVS